MSNQTFVAFDLGAESGRAMLAVLEDERLHLHETHRFLNAILSLPSGLHWNVLNLWSNLVEGLRKTGAAARQRGWRITSLGVDTWGVDFALMGASGQMLGLPFAYRDPRHQPAMERAFAKLGEKSIYDSTGIQLMPINTLYQLLAQHDAEPALLGSAHRLLMMPDLLHYFFSGVMVNEATEASTTQMIDPRQGDTGAWHKTLLEKLHLPTHLLGEIVPAGAVIGSLREQVAAEAGVEPMRVIVPGSHDTASAVAAVPAADGGSWAYLSSGTWSLMGVELDQPLISDDTRRLGFTNERGVGGKIRFLKNICGLWLVQECRRDLAKYGQNFDYPLLTQLAAEAQPFTALINPAHPPFGAPGDMLAKITRFSEMTQQPAPQAPGAFVRCCLESLALTYRWVFLHLELLLGRRLDVLHIVGGGGHNALLNQMTADAINRPVIVGPYEATAVGNALTQAMGAGQVRDLSHLRGIVRCSFDVVTFEPHNAAAFEKQAGRFEELLTSAPGVL